MSDEKEKLRKEIEIKHLRGAGSAVTRVALACLGGVPVAGGVFAGMTSWLRRIVS